MKKQVCGDTDPSTLQDRQLRYNVILRHVRALLMQWKSSHYCIFWVWICSLGPTYNAHAPYRYQWPARL